MTRSLARFLPALMLACATIAQAQVPNPDDSAMWQKVRADLFGTAAGGVVLLISALVLGANAEAFKSPVPYVLGGVAAAGAITIVSLLWAEAAENPGASPPAPGPGPAVQPGKPSYKSYW